MTLTVWLGLMENGRRFTRYGKQRLPENVIGWKYERTSLVFWTRLELQNNLHGGMTGQPWDSSESWEHSYQLMVSNQ